MVVTPKQAYKGSPASDTYKPRPADIISLLNWLQTAVTVGGKLANSAAGLQAIVPSAAGAPGGVYGASAASENGIYIGDPGSVPYWTKIADWPVSMAELVNVAGTANAITADIDTGVSPGAVRVRLLVPQYTNTGATTLSENGEFPIDILSRTGNSLVGGELIAGELAIIGEVEGELRLTNSERQLPFQRSYSAGTAYAPGDLVESGGSIWYSLQDANQGNTPSEGAFWTLFLPGVSVADGTITDDKLAPGSVVHYIATETVNLSSYDVDYDDIGAAASNLAKIQAAIDAAAAAKKILRFEDILYFAGPLYTRSNSHWKCTEGAVLYPTTWSILAASGTPGGGQIIGNVSSLSPSAPDDWVVENVYLENMQMDGINMPVAMQGDVISATSTTITFDTWVDERLPLVGERITIFGGTGEGGIRTIQSFDAGTRTATITSAWSITPDATSKAGIGTNDNAIAHARGAFDVRLMGGFVRNFAATYLGGGSGGKGFNFEQGCFYCSADDMLIENCGFGGFTQGIDGTFSGYSAGNQAKGLHLRSVKHFRGSNLTIKNCEAGIAHFGADATADPTGDADKHSAIYTNITMENCGGAVSRPLTSGFYKSGAIAIGEGSNVKISNAVLHIKSGYPTWPSGGELKAGAGLSGPPNAVVGWGRDVDIELNVYGPVDYLWQFDDCRNLAETASPTGVPQNVYEFNLNIKHMVQSGEQALLAFVDQPGTGGTVAADEVSGKLTLSTNKTPTSGYFGSNMSYDGFICDLSISNIAGSPLSHKNWRGRASTINSFGGTNAVCFNEFLDTFTVAAGAATSFRFPIAQGFLSLNARNNSGVFLEAYVDVSGSASITPSSMIGANVVTGVGVLTGGGGTASKFNVNTANDGYVYIANNLAGSVTFQIKTSG